MKFKNGRKVKAETYEAIRWMTKVGVLTRKTWYKIFGRGQKRWQQIQLQSFVKNRIFKLHPSQISPDIFVMDTNGIKMVKALSWKHSSRIDPQYIYHDESLALGLLKLERHGVCRKWVMAAEFKARHTKDFRLELTGKDRKKIRYPDAVANIQVQEETKTWAIEYESKNQGSWRYKKILEAYRYYHDTYHILFVVKNKATSASIKRALKRIDSAYLPSRITIADNETWQNNPQEIFMKKT